MNKWIEKQRHIYTFYIYLLLCKQRTPQISERDEQKQFKIKPTIPSEQMDADTQRQLYSMMGAGLGTTSSSSSLNSTTRVFNVSSLAAAAAAATNDDDDDDGGGGGVSSSESNKACVSWASACATNATRSVAWRSPTATVCLSTMPHKYIQQQAHKKTSATTQVDRSAMVKASGEMRPRATRWHKMSSWLWSVPVDVGARRARQQTDGVEQKSAPNCARRVAQTAQAEHIVVVGDAQWRRAARIQGLTFGLGDKSFV